MGSRFDEESFFSEEAMEEGFRKFCSGTLSRSVTSLSSTPNQFLRELLEQGWTIEQIKDSLKELEEDGGRIYADGERVTAENIVAIAAPSIDLPKSLVHLNGNELLTIESNIAHKLFRQSDINGIELKAAVIGNTETSLTVDIIQDDTYSITGVEKLSPYEKMIADALCTLWSRKVQVFTIDMLYRCARKTDGQPTEQETKNLNQILRKFRHLDIKIHATEEFRKRKIITPVEEWERTRVLFNLEKGRFKVNGKWEDAYRFDFNGPPILLEYSLLTKQIATYNEEIFKIRERKSGTAWFPLKMNNERLCIVDDLLRELRILGAGDSEYRKILFDNVFERAGINLMIANKDGTVTKDRRKANTLKAFIMTVLAYWKHIVFVADYNPIYERRTFKGVTVSLPKQKLLT